MMHNVLIVSPLTREIIPYYTSNWDKDFSSIIDDLSSRIHWRAFSLMYYDGLDTIEVRQNVGINYYASEHGLILALSRIKRFPTLIIPRNHRLLLLLSPDLSQIIPYLITKNTTLNEILDFLMKKHRLFVSILKYIMVSNILIKVELRDEDISSLYLEKKPKVLLLKERPDFLKGLQILENLPDEQAFSFFLTLPTSDVERLCYLSKDLKKWCQDEPLWRELVKRDFRVEDKGNIKSWVDFYQSIIRDNDELLVIGARYGDQALLDRAFDSGVSISSEALDGALRRGDKSLVEKMVNYSEGLGNELSDNQLLEDAASEGYIELLQWLIDRGEILDEESIEERSYALDSAAENGHFEIVKMLLNVMEPIEPGNLYEPVISAAEAGHEDIVKFLVNKIEEIKPPERIGAYSGRISFYNLALANAADGGYIEIVKFLLSKGANFYDNAIIKAARSDRGDIIELLLPLTPNPPYNELLVRAAMNNNLKLVQLALDHGANKYTDAMWAAAFNGHKNIVRMMLDLGVDHSKFPSISKLNTLGITSADNLSSDIINLINQYREADGFEPFSRDITIKILK